MEVPPYIIALTEFAINIGLIFGPLIGYAAQIMEIRNKKSSLGFSPRVSAILILANVTRVFFWYYYIPQ